MPADLDEIVATVPVLGFGVIGHPLEPLMQVVGNRRSRGDTSLRRLAVGWRHAHRRPSRAVEVGRRARVLRASRASTPTRAARSATGPTTASSSTHAAVAVVPEDTFAEASPSPTTSCPRPDEGGWAKVLDLVYSFERFQFGGRLARKAAKPLRVVIRGVRGHDDAAGAVGVDLVTIDLRVNGRLPSPITRGLNCSTVFASDSTASSRSSGRDHFVHQAPSTAVRASIGFAREQHLERASTPITRVNGTIGVEQNSPTFTPGVANCAVGRDREIAAATSWHRPRSRCRAPGDDRLRQRVHREHQLDAHREELVVELGSRPTISDRS